MHTDLIRVEDLRAADLLDEPQILSLNEANVVATAPLSASALRNLLSMAFRARVHGRHGHLHGFLIALDEAAPSESPHFRWFLERLPRFVYIDRVVVSDAVRRRGLGRALYRDLAIAAQRAGQHLLCCEVNVDPPNPVSDAFHASMGFVEMGRALLAGSQKSVRYLVRDVTILP
jgi:hypothetical protein